MKLSALEYCHDFDNTMTWFDLKMSATEQLTGLQASMFLKCS
jgi:hypothetical protein